MEQLRRARLRKMKMRKDDEDCRRAALIAGHYQRPRKVMFQTKPKNEKNFKKTFITNDLNHEFNAKLLSVLKQLLKLNFLPTKSFDDTCIRLMKVYQLKAH